MSAKNRPKVRIDGVLYVPVSEAHPDYDKWIDALVKQWAGTNWQGMFPDAPTYLRVAVSDCFEDDMGETLQEFIGRVLASSLSEAGEGGPTNG